MATQKWKDKEVKGKEENKRQGAQERWKIQKNDEAWKKIPPSPKDPQEKVVTKITYHWCIHHMAWTVHKPEDCRLGKDQSVSMKPSSHTIFCFNVATGEKTSESSLRALMSQLAAASADVSWLIRPAWLAWPVLSYKACDAMGDARAFETLFSTTIHLMTEIFSVLLIAF